MLPWHLMARWAKDELAGLNPRLHLVFRSTNCPLSGQDSAADTRIISLRTQAPRWKRGPDTQLPRERAPAAARSAHEWCRPRRIWNWFKSRLVKSGKLLADFSVAVVGGILLQNSLVQRACSVLFSKFAAVICHCFQSGGTKTQG
jgi:hypothetical protein